MSQFVNILNFWEEEYVTILKDPELNITEVSIFLLLPNLYQICFFSKFIPIYESNKQGGRQKIGNCVQKNLIFDVSDPHLSWF
jgi:hypothetical protein